jgi:(2Fe-2S) ferredoxin
MSTRRYEILVCRGPTCGKRRDSRAIYDALGALLDAHELTREVELGWKTCFGRCARGPNALVRARAPDEGRAHGQGFGLALVAGDGPSAFYTGLRPGDACALIQEHVLGAAIVARLQGGGEAGAGARSERPLDAVTGEGRADANADEPVSFARRPEDRRSR